jgi:predicted thioesterase
MENIASDLAQKDMTPDMTSVGIHIDMKHTAPSLLGDVIRIVALIQEKNGREINFFIQAFNEKNEILGEATHKRAVLNRKKFEEKIGLRLPK